MTCWDNITPRGWLTCLLGYDGVRELVLLVKNTTEDQVVVTPRLLTMVSPTILEGLKELFR